MAHYALINSDNLVVKVITGVDEDTTQIDLDGTEVGGSTEAWEQFYQNQPWHAGLTCKRTSYNGNIRKQYAGVGWTYNSEHDIFISPQPFINWVLDDNFDWQAPVPYPNDGFEYVWNEHRQNWIDA